jgi:hypothetical protein
VEAGRADSAGAGTLSMTRLDSGLAGFDGREGEREAGNVVTAPDVAGGAPGVGE